MNSIKRLNVLLAAVALSCASSFAHAQTTSHQHVSHHHVVAQSSASMDHEPTQEETAKAIEMVYNDSVTALQHDHPNAELFNCNCTIYNQGQ